MKDPEEVWDAFKRETLKATEECYEERPRSGSGVAPDYTFQRIEESRSAGLDGNLVQYRTLAQMTKVLLRNDKERYVREFTDNVKGSLNANNLRPAHQAVKNLCFISTTQTSTIRTAAGRIVSDADEVRFIWAEYFGQSYVTKLRSRWLFLASVEIAAADPPIDETPLSLAEVREAVKKLKVGKAGMPAMSARRC